MGSDWIDSLLAESMEVLEQGPSFYPAFPLSPESLEQQCAQLLEAFTLSADPRFFEGFYSLTHQLLTWFCQKQLQNTGLKSESNELTQRMYGILCECVLRPHFAMPVDNIVNWCYCLIDNLIDAEKRLARSESPKEGLNESDSYSLCPSSTEAWMRSTHLEEPERIMERLAEAWIGNDANLDTIERKVLILFYKDKMNVKSLADLVGLSRERAERLLSISRLKMLRTLKLKEAGDLALEEEKLS